jgi:hypothetical protein
MRRRRRRSGWGLASVFANFDWGENEVLLLAGSVVAIAIGAVASSIVHCVRFVSFRFVSFRLVLSCQCSFVRSFVIVGRREYNATIVI